MSSSCKGREGRVAAPRPPAGTCTFVSTPHTPPRPKGCSLLSPQTHRDVPLEGTRAGGEEEEVAPKPPPGAPHLLARLQELLEGHHAVPVPVHLLQGKSSAGAIPVPVPAPSAACRGGGRAHLEEELHVLGGCAVPQGGQGAAPHHVIDGLHDLQHLLGRAQSGAGVTKTSPTPPPMLLPKEATSSPQPRLPQFCPSLDVPVGATTPAGPSSSPGAPPW